MKRSLAGNVTMCQEWVIVVLATCCCCYHPTTWTDWINQEGPGTRDGIARSQVMVTFSTTVGRALATMWRSSYEGWQRLLQSTSQATSQRLVGRSLCNSSEISLSEASSIRNRPFRGDILGGLQFLNKRRRWISSSSRQQQTR